ncbi:hypothetical protein UFOVP56_36 [uncultured Caudovirales phage]|uniref:Uncharacterized protein n=1 Tax=uncultured Caudovirales phage TaxID=2100421 RepID=A0A6J5T847_9CAUD|nr:hypothetical protein UFOVP56_36 [uncultured Caudovirales phage]
MSYNIDEITRHYAAAALWSSVDDNDDPLDENYDLSDIDPDTLAAMRADCAAFVALADPLLIEKGLNSAKIGHDFWLTRNGHGVGFWDRGLGEVGDKLTEIGERFKGVDLYVGDDGRLYT